MHEKDNTRRTFLRATGATALGVVIGGALPACTYNVVGLEDAPGITIDGNTIVLDLSEPELEPLSREGGFLLIRQATTMVVNVDGATLRAFTSTCTHLQCTITRFEGEFFECPCHGSRFNMNGNVVRGPAEAPLQTFELTRDGDTVTITK